LGAEVDLAEAFAPRNASTRSVYTSLLEEAAEHAGLLPEAGIEDEFVGGLVGKLQKQLSWLANRSGLDEVLIAAVLRDVGRLPRPGRRPSGRCRRRCPPPIIMC
jgi:endonuclease G, mitochondrial